MFKSPAQHRCTFQKETLKYLWRLENEHIMAHSAGITALANQDCNRQQQLTLEKHNEATVQRTTSVTLCGTCPG